MRNGDATAGSRRVARRLIAAVAVALIAGCTSSAGLVPGDSAATVGTGGGAELRELEGREPGPMVDARRFVGRSNKSIDDSPGEQVDLLIGRDTLRFDASCNEVDVAYRLVDGVLYLSDVRRSTAVACYPEFDENAPHVGELLDSRPTFALDGDALTVRSSFGELQLIDAAAPHPDDVPLVGTEWSLRLVVVQDNGGFMSLAEPTPVARFTADAVELTFRCRTAQLAAMVDIDGGTITFAPAAGGRSGLLGSPPDHAGDITSA